MMGGTISPAGVPIEFGGETRHILWDYNVIDVIQEEYHCSIIDTIYAMTGEKGEGYINASITLEVLFRLLDEEIDRTAFITGRPCTLQRYTKKQVGYLLTKANDVAVLNAIIRAWSMSLPDPDEDDAAITEEDDEEIARAMGSDDPNSSSGQ